MKTHVLIMFGGVSAEHEVSVITGLQVIEKIDRNRYEVLPVYVAKNGALFALPTLKTRRDFTHAQHLPLTFSRSKATPTLTYRSSPLHHTTYIPEVAYLAFHGGLGEGGAVQGFLDTLGISHTGPSQESAVICMNKQLTKTVIHEVGVPTVPGVALFASDIRQNSLAITKRTITQLGLPAIIKPVHLGSSIGITVAHTDIDLEKALLEASYMDSEVLIETYIPSFVEYNISLRTQDGVIELSEIERPLASGEMLSFSDKYEKGAKKTGGSGMASLQRELPAYIDTSLKTRIHDYAQKAYQATRSRGVARIDFMYTPSGELYLTEINPIPGSMAFYLWEANGVSFTQQISDSIDEALKQSQYDTSLHLEHTSKIVEKFISQ